MKDHTHPCCTAKSRWAGPRRSEQLDRCSPLGPWMVMVLLFKSRHSQFAPYDLLVGGMQQLRWPAESPCLWHVIVEQRRGSACSDESFTPVSRSVVRHAARGGTATAESRHADIRSSGPRLDFRRPPLSLRRRGKVYRVGEIGIAGASPVRLAPIGRLVRIPLSLLDFQPSFPSSFLPY